MNFRYLRGPPPTFTSNYLKITWLIRMRPNNEWLDNAFGTYGSGEIA
jgi:hypothetical protein